MTAQVNSRTRYLSLLILTALFTPTPGMEAWSKPAPSPFDYSELRSVVIFDDARSKPLDTFARETLRLVTSREYWSAKKAPHEFLTRDPMTNLLSLLFEPEKWKDIPCIHLAKADVKKVLGVDSKAEWISYNELRASSGLKEAFREIMRKQQVEEKLTPLEQKIGELHGVLNTLDGIFFGTDIRVVPARQTGGGLQWKSLEEMASDGSDESIRAGLSGMLAGFTTQDSEGFRESARKFAHELRARGGEDYPTAKVLEYEIQYNAFKPFRKAWEFLLLGTILFGVAMGVANRYVYLAAWASTAVGFGLSSYGLLLRVLVAGRPPVSNMYESVVYMGWGVLLFAAIFELVYRQRIFGLCGSLMGVTVLILADMLPFDPAISPLVPVLRSNYWLLIHVMTIVISYSAFGLAMAIAHFSLLFYLFAPGKKEIIRTSNAFVYRGIQLGVLLLTAGTILGGVWANESWGRFWGFDPKETWALISILGYLALLHARLFGMIGPFGMAVGAVLGFQLILMTWYGVNFVLGTGLHSYGFGTGGQGYIAGYLLAEIGFMSMVALRYKFLGGMSSGIGVEGSSPERLPKAPAAEPSAT